MKKRQQRVRFTNSRRPALSEDEKARSGGTPFVFPAWGGDLGVPSLIDYLTYADEGYARNAIVHACVREISRAAPSARLQVQRTLPNAQAEVWEGHYLQQVLCRPNKHQSQTEFVELYYTYLNIDGNAFILRERQGRKTRHLWLPRPDRMRPVIKDRDLAGYVYVADNGEKIPFLPDEVIHVKEPNPGDPYEGLGRGLSPLAAAAVEADVDNRATVFSKKFFDNAAVPFGLLKSKNQLSDVEVRRIRARIKEQYAGEDNWHEMMILDADADYQRMGLNLQEMAFPDLRAISETRICATYKVPPILVGVKAGLDASTYSNYSQARRAMWEDKIIPDNNKLADALTAELADELGPDGIIAHDYSRVVALQEDRNSRFDRANQGVNGGWITVNEARREVGLGPVRGGDVFLRPLMSQSTPGNGEGPKQLSMVKAGGPVEAKAQHTGAMVAFFLPEDAAQRLALSEDQTPAGSELTPAEELHITLAFLGDTSGMSAEVRTAAWQALQNFASQHGEIRGTVNGVGRFTNDSGGGMNAFYATFDSPDLVEFRQQLVQALTEAGVAPKSNHGFVPHITLAYIPMDAPTPEIRLEAMELEFSEVQLAWGGEITTAALGSSKAAKWEQWGGAIHKRMDRTARAWELKYLAAARAQFGREARELEARLRAEKGQRKAVPWGEVQRELFGYVDGTSQALWAAEFRPLITGLLGDQGEEWSDELGIAWDFQNPQVQAFLHRYSLQFAERIGATTREALRTVLAQAQEEQWQITRLITEVGRLYEGWRDFQRAEMIARSETIRASNAGAAEAYRQAGVRRKQWYAATDERTCLFCGEMHEKIVETEAVWFHHGDEMVVDDQVLRMSYEDVGYPPLHPDCRCTVLPVIGED